ncbi:MULTISPECIES: pentapeptide repeat-containing protein [unclassified Rhodococcus (in: high G+C Gram-positive bacteria)]|uniref:pentapeptide repeat-containing protein n=1 Tax=Rhodococcus sp. SJ-3 TaxID=3454628 RepID=UPI003F79E850
MLVLLVAEWSTPDGVAVLSADLAGIGRTVGLICAAAVAVPGVLLAYRRQKSLDDSNNLKAEADYRAAGKDYDDRRDGIIRDRRARFDSIAEQLAAPALIIRLTGVSAMEALADEWLNDFDIDEDQRRREAHACVNVLCSYVRSPFDSAVGIDRPASLKKKVEKDSKTGSEEHHEYLMNDREVRETIVRILASHLRNLPVVPSVRRYPGPWSYMDLDLAGAYLHNAEFAGCVFGGHVTFTGARFTGDWASFRLAEFSGRTVTFADAVFDCSNTSFEGVRFAGGDVWFSNTVFNNSGACFNDLESTGGIVRFVRTGFNGDTVEFRNALFAGDGVIFGSARFLDCVNIDFTKARFIGKLAQLSPQFRDAALVTFREALFTADQVRFTGVRFKDVIVDFCGCDFSLAQNLPVGEHTYDDKTVFPACEIVPPKGWVKLVNK